MPKYEVQVIETDEFGWNIRLEESVLFQTEEAAKAFQEAYNKNTSGEERLTEIEGNFMVARPPREIPEVADVQEK